MGDADEGGAEPEHTEELLVPPPRGSAAPTSAEGPKALVGPAIRRGTAIGRYIVIDVLGGGGMGLVYLAIDPELDRKVAIKLMRRRTPEGHARLAREAQAMARVQHSNVVAVHDVGSYGDLMFVAMDYIDGTTLAAWLAASRRTWREIVEVFVDAGNGLAAAHAAGVVHRDFKPDNILIDKADRVYVTDFGLARAVASGDDEVEPTPDAAASAVEPPAGRGSQRRLDTPVTRADTIIGTPGYMAPEQGAGKPADERADQFGFATSLYEALYGELPPGGTNRGAPARLRRIVTRGIAKAPEDRFASMGELLGELRATVTRRRRVLWLAAIGVPAVLAVAAWTLLASRDEPQVCRRADARLVGIWDDGVRTSVQRAFTATGAAYAEQTYATAAPLLDGYARGWVDMHTETCEATRVHGDQSDEVLSLRMGCLDQRLRELKALTALLASADVKIVEKTAQATNALTPLAVCADVDTLKAPARPFAPPPSEKLEEVKTELAQAKVSNDAGRYKDGLAVASKAVDHARALRYRALEADALYLRGLLESANGDAKAAEGTLADALYAATATRRDDIAALAALRVGYVIGYSQSRPADAERWVAMAEAFEERAGRPDRIEAERLAVVGMLASRQGRFAESIDVLRRSLVLAEKVYGAEHLELWKRHSDLGASYMENGQPSEAIQALDRALEIQGKTQGRDHPDAAKVLGNLAIAHARLGADDEALDLLRKVVALRERHFGEDSPFLVAPLNNLASTLADLRDYEQALPVAQRAVDLAGRKLGDKHMLAAIALVTLGSTLVEVGKHADAEARLNQALATAQAAGGAEHAVVADADEALARLRERQNRPKDVLVLATKALALREKGAHEHAPELAEPLTLAGRAHLTLGKPADAVALLERALAVRERAGARPRALAETRFALAQAVWPTDKPRSTALARTARGDYAKAPRSEHDVKRIDAWLAAHGGAP